MLINLIFKEAGLVEKFGSGISRIIDACKKHVSCTVDFVNEQQGFKVILSKQGHRVGVKVGQKVGEGIGVKIGEKLTQNQQLIIAEMRKNKHVTIQELAKLTSISQRNIEINISKLKTKNIIQRIGSDKSGEWKVQVLTDS